MKIFALIDWQMLPQYWIAFSFKENGTKSSYHYRQPASPLVYFLFPKVSFIRGNLVNCVSGSDSKRNGSGWLKTNN